MFITIMYIKINTSYVLHYPNFTNSLGMKDVLKQIVDLIIYIYIYYEIYIINILNFRRK